MERANEVHVSAVICTRNRDDKIGTAVASVLANDYPSFDLTIIDQSTDGSHAQDRRGDRAIPGCATCTAPKLGSRGRTTTGSAAPMGEILAFTDDDCIVPQDWISNIVGAFTAEPDGDLLYGQVLPAGTSEDDRRLTPLLKIPVARAPEQARRVQGLRDGRQLRRAPPPVHLGGCVRRGARRRRGAVVVAGLRHGVPDVPVWRRHPAAPRGHAAPRRSARERGLAGPPPRLRLRRRRLLHEARPLPRSVRAVAVHPPVRRHCRALRRQDGAAPADATTTTCVGWCAAPGTASSSASIAPTGSTCQR